jgi:hypothetical protein
MARKRGFFTDDEKAAIARAIAAGRERSTGRLRVYIDKSAGPDIMARVQAIFAQLGLGGAADKNGVLLYVAVREGGLAILGDTGINAKVPEGYWDRVRDTVQDHFRAGDFLGGVLYFIENVGRELHRYFPREAPGPKCSPEHDALLSPAEKHGLKHRASRRKARRRFAGPRKQISRAERREFFARWRDADRVFNLGAASFVLPIVGLFLTATEYAAYRRRYAGREDETYAVQGAGVSISKPLGAPTPDEKAKTGLVISIVSICVWAVFVFGFIAHHIDLQRKRDEWNRRYRDWNSSIPAREHEAPPGAVIFSMPGAARPESG